MAGASLASGCAVEPGVVTNYHVPEDVGAALEQLPKISSVEVGSGGIPYFVSGDLGRSGRVADLAMAQTQLAPALAQIAPVFRLRAADLAPIEIASDDLGMTHVRYMQTRDGLDVVGGELVVHLGADGVLRSVNASARGDLTLSATPQVAAETARSRALAFTSFAAGADAPRLTYVISSLDGSLHLAWETLVTGIGVDRIPVVDRVYIDAHTGVLADRHPQIQTAKNRKVYSSNNGTSTPGTLKRSEGGAANSDVEVNYAYDNTGTTYDVYKTLFNRDSFDNAGGTLISSVHYSSSYVNAYWDGTQMVYGDGDGVQSSPLDRALDVTAHELTHAVTERTAGLIYQNEPGGLNEAMSDIMGSVVEWYKDGQVVSSDTWKVGEDIWTPATSGDALRYMNNPTIDGYSVDWYPDLITGSADNGGVHGNSGIANLAFYLTAVGGTHPRSKSTINVPGIGMDKTARIYYRALTVYMSSNTNFAGARTACASAATDLYGTTEKFSVEAAWYAVGVGTDPSGGNPPPTPPPGGTVLTSGVAKAVPSLAANATQTYTIAVPAGATSLSVVTSGGTGDADIYVKAGTAPTTTTYDGKSDGSTTAETVTITSPTAGTYYILVNAYSAISGVSITGTVSGGTTPPPGGNVLQKDVPVTGLSAAANTNSATYTFVVPAGATSATFRISGGNGDADIYVRKGSAPTTGTYDGRPYLTGNNESWSSTQKATLTAPGTWYIFVRAYTAYSGVSLVATYQ